MVVNKSKAAFRTIAEVADKLGVGTHVLRFWETKFPQIKPLKMNGGRRYYRPDDVKLLECIRRLLHQERYTIEGVQKLFREQGTKPFVGETVLEDLFAADETQTTTESRPADDCDGIGGERVDEIVRELVSIREELRQGLE